MLSLNLGSYLSQPAEETIDLCGAISLRASGQDLEAQQFESCSQVHCHRARYYSPVLGRFLERDPLAAPESLRLMKLRKPSLFRSADDTRFAFVASPEISSLLLRHRLAAIFGSQDLRNLYEYVHGQPGKAIDPTGLHWISVSIGNGGTVRVWVPDSPTDPNASDDDARCRGGENDEGQDNICSDPAGVLNVCPSLKQCCINHDRCYHENDCNSDSWFFPVCGSFACALCNYEAVFCISTAGVAGRLDPRYGQLVPPGRRIPRAASQPSGQ